MVHPTVTYYACQVCPETVLELLVYISDDRVHNFNAIFWFTQLAVDHLCTIRGLDINVIQWTDGCALRYKLKGPFADIFCALSDFGCAFERNIFGSHHSKGLSDGESAVVMTRAIRSGDAVIANVRNYCKNSNLSKQPGEDGCKHSLHTFFLHLQGRYGSI